MAYMEYATKIAAPVDKVWKLFCDLQNPAVIKGTASRVEMEPLASGSWIGVERVSERGGGWYEEVFTTIDHEKHIMAWIITDAGPIPVTDYDCLVRMIPAGKNACHVGFEARFKPVDVAAEAVEVGFISGWVKLCDNVRRIVANG